MIIVTTPANMTEQTLFPTPLRVCQTCRYCTPKQSEGPIGLFCNALDVLTPGFTEEAKRIGQVPPPEANSPTSIFWAVLKHCGDERKYWEGA